MALYKNGSITIKNEDIERVMAAKPENTSNARAYFKQTKLKNSTHISAAELKKEWGLKYEENLKQANTFLEKMSSF